jgi:phosphatidate cytidylyltransferase
VADGGTSTSLLPVRSRRRGSPPPREVADVPPAVSGPATGRLGTGSLTPPAGLTGSGGSGGLGGLLGAGAGLTAAAAGTAAGPGGASVAGTAGTAAAGTLDAVVGLGRAGRAARSGRTAPPRAEGPTSAGEPPRPSLRAVATPPGDEPTSMLPPVPADLPGGPGDPAPPSRSRRSDGRRPSGSTAALSAVPVSTTGSRAGRNLPAAIAVGLGLVGAILASLLVRKEAFVVLVAAAVVIALWELSGALAKKGVSVALVPLAVGAVGMLVSAFVAGEDGLLVSFTLTAFGVLLWRIIDGPEGAARDVAAGVFVAAYVPFLAGFAMLMLAAPDGPYRVIVFIAVTVANDVGGYASGVLFGRHPMAPSISPKKSWEGLAGSVVLCMIVGAGTVHFLLDGSLLAGVAVGAAAAFTATLGDLSESLVKRDLGIKDMGSLLPGHGGIMDRLDSLLPTAPAVALLLMLLVPVP